MLKEKVVAVVLMMVFSQPLWAEDRDTILYATIGPWDVRIDNNKCFLAAVFEGGTIFRLGMDDDYVLYTIIGNADWKSIEYGKSYDLEIQFGNESRWSGEATGYSFDQPENQPYLHLTISGDIEKKTLFFTEFIQERSVEIFFNGTSISRLSLKDSFAASRKFVECQEQMKKSTATPPSSTDPFSNPSGTRTDPFKT